MPTLSSYQAQHKEWSEKNFPNETWQDVLMGVVEEVGELNHYLLKQKQGIRGSYEEHEAGAQDSVGDIIVYLSHVCILRGWDLEKIVMETFESVLKRDWKKDKLKGLTATSAIQNKNRLIANVPIESEDLDKPLGQCQHGIISPNRFRYCSVCRDNAVAHY